MIYEHQKNTIEFEDLERSIACFTKAFFFLNRTKAFSLLPSIFSCSVTLSQLLCPLVSLACWAPRCSWTYLQSKHLVCSLVEFVGNRKISGPNLCMPWVALVTKNWAPIQRMQIKLVCMNLHNLKEEKHLGRLFIVCFKDILILFQRLILFLSLNIISVYWKLAKYSDY